jgi:hypothetical protein
MTSKKGIAQLRGMLNNHGTGVWKIHGQFWGLKHLDFSLAHELMEVTRGSTGGLGG